MGKKGSVFITLGLLLIAAALVISLYNLYDAYSAWKASTEVVAQLEQLLPAETVAQESPAEQQSSGADDVDPTETPPEPTIPDVPSYILVPEMEMPVKTIDNRDYIGILEIPAFGLSLSVMSQWSYPNLKISPCRYVGSAYMDNLIIAAHNYQGHFGRLKELDAGDQIVFTDMDGNVFLYEVAFQETLQRTDVEEMESGDWDLTLFTCTVGGSTRVTIRCERVEGSIYQQK